MTRVLFFGTSAFAAPSLQALVDCGYAVQVVTQPDRPTGRGLRLSPSPVKQAAVQLGLCVLQPERCRRKSFVDEAARFAPDIIVTAAYGQILSRRLLDLPTTGAALNVHASLLPRWRGAAPIHHALLAGDCETGVTIMQMVEELDAGPVYACRKRPIECDSDTGSLEALLAHDGAELLREVLSQLPDGLHPTPQPDDGVTYAPPIGPADAEIHWSESALRCLGRVRAMAPRPGARFMHRGRGVKLWKAQIAPVSGDAGCVIGIHPEGLVIACGEESLVLQQVQPDGRPKMSALDWANGVRLRAHDRLG